MRIDPIAFILCMITGAFVLLIYMLTLDQKSRKSASWHIVFITFTGATLASAYLSSLSFLVSIVLVCIVLGLILSPNNNSSMISVFIAWSVIMGVAIGKGLTPYVIPLLTTLGCAIIIMMEHRHCL